jgi:outer membrane protein OmpA-like peptidoglycan-associated protein
MRTLKKITFYLIIFSSMAMISTSCKLNKTTKGAIIGTGGGAVIGAVVGRAAGNTALGALIGATVGGVAGVIIGRKMDKQAEEIKKTVPGVNVYRVGEGIIVEFTDKVLFDYNKSDVNAGAKVNMDKLVTVLNNNPDTNIEIQGHTDNTGSDSNNMTLSKRRASAVSNYLTAQGVPSRRISTRGYGESAPNYSNDNEETRSQNRRVEFLITANTKMSEEAKKESANK